MNNTCKDCNERTIECHTICEKYKTFVKENAETNKRKRTSDADCYLKEKHARARYLYTKRQAKKRSGG